MKRQVKNFTVLLQRVYRLGFLSHTYRHSYLVMLIYFSSCSYWQACGKYFVKHLLGTGHTVNLRIDTCMMNSNI